MSYIPINYFHANAHIPADFPTAAMRSAIQLFIFRSCAIPYTREIGGITHSGNCHHRFAKWLIEQLLVTTDCRVKKV
jgi:hypothetical protein